ncbi:hypothetical protein CISG_02587 [Coccidioides immitis RMSCC 3703]|uniref:Uncharacterized protein n=1 Tax=Coccidioides immitis RMSCC 3703 TaxID=454286 RepID=A0A0J8R9W4_COCIT|nr:hypothetical protein CISG_02587 [Coccidioides immitis RMSCC 3703]
MLCSRCRTHLLSRLPFYRRSSALPSSRCSGIISRTQQRTYSTPTNPTQATAAEVSVSTSGSANDATGAAAPAKAMNKKQRKRHEKKMAAAAASKPPVIPLHEQSIDIIAADAVAPDAAKNFEVAFHGYRAQKNNQQKARAKREGSRSRSQTF